MLFLRCKHSLLWPYHTGLCKIKPKKARWPTPAQERSFYLAPTLPSREQQLLSLCSCLNRDMAIRRAVLKPIKVERVKFRKVFRRGDEGCNDVWNSPEVQNGHWRKNNWRRKSDIVGKGLDGGFSAELLMYTIYFYSGEQVFL